MEQLTALAQFVAETQYDDIPAGVIDRAKWVLRDTVGVILGGMREPEVTALANYAAEHEPGSVSLYGHGGTVKPGWAVMVHGTAGTTLEMDEGHAYTRGHPAIHAVPPALALGEAQNASGKDTLTALILGYEAAARVGVASRLRDGVHPFGAWGVLGAAAVAARFKRMDADATRGVLELAAAYAIAPSFGAAYQGANVRNTYAGTVNQLGLRAADLYELGFQGERGGVQTSFGYILGQSFDPDALTDALGTRYEMIRGYFKPYSGCRYSHAAIDAVFSITGHEAIDPESVDLVEVATYDIAATLDDPHPLTPLAGRFSIPHIVASALTLGSAGPEAFSAGALQNEFVRSLAARVSVSEDPAYTALTPGQRPAKITLRYRDGTTQQAEVMGSKGDPDQPMSADELRAKFDQLAEPGIGAENAAALWDHINTLETLPDLTALTNAVRLQR